MYYFCRMKVRTTITLSDDLLAKLHSQGMDALTESEKQKLRQAISLAMDSQEFISLHYQGIGKPAQSVIPPGIFGYEPDLKNPYRQTNIAKAKQLLADAGYPDGIDPKNETFTVVGIGDMSGDVFGNGMLLSRTIRLVGAFDHRDVLRCEIVAAPA